MRMTSDRDVIHQSYDLLVDSQAIRKRVLAGDVAFAQRILLTALIKGSQQDRSHILASIDSEHLFTNVFRPLFLWVSDDLSSTGQVDESALYERMEAHVREHWTSERDPNHDASQYSAEQVMQGYLSPIDHVLAIDMPDAETIDHAIATLQRFHSWRSDFVGKWDASSVHKSS
jgi:hypothetical protein